MNMEEFIKKLDIACRILYSQKKEYLAEYLMCNKRSLEQIAGGKPYVLCTYYVPSEIASMYDAEFIYIERIVGIAVSCGIVGERENRDLPERICSYHKAMWELIETEVLPLPSLILAFFYPYTDAWILCERLHERYQIPILRIREGKQEELRNCCQLLKQYFPCRQSIEETAAFANEAVILKAEIDKKRVEYPGIVRSDDMLKLFTVENMIGSRQAVRVLQCLLAHIDIQIKAYVREKRFRIFWMGLIPLYDNNMLSFLEAKYNCQFVYEEMWMFGNLYLRPSFFYEDMENKIKHSLFYDLDKRISELIKKIKELEVKNVINFSQAHCSFLPPQIKEIKYALQQNHIHMYNLGADVVKGDFARGKIEKIIEACKESECL